MEAKLRVPSDPRGVYEVGNVILIEKADVCNFGLAPKS